MTKFNDFRAFLMAKGANAQTVEDVCKSIETSCVWLQEDEEISTDIGVDLLRAEVLDEATLDALYGLIIEEHNRRVRARATAGIDDRIYERLVETVSTFGIEDAFGDGDYWVVADSIAGGHPSIMKFGGAALPDQLLQQLSAIQREFNGVKGLTIIDPEGTVLWQTSRS